VKSPAAVEFDDAMNGGGNDEVVAVPGIDRVLAGCGFGLGAADWDDAQGETGRKA
jgi:hypothetical protein